MTRTSLWLAGTAILLLAPAAYAQDDEGAAAPLLDALRQAMGDEATLAYDRISGTAADTTLMNVRIEGKDKATLSIGEVHLVGIAEPAVEGALPDIDRVALSNLVMNAPDSAEEGGHLNLRSVELSGADLNAIVGGAVTGDPATFMSTLNLGNLAVDGLELVIDKGGAAEGQTVRWDKLTVDGVKGGVIGNLDVDDFDMTRKGGEDAGHLSFDAIRFTDLDLGSIAAMAAAPGGFNPADLSSLGLSGIEITGMTADLPNSPHARIDQFKISDIVHEAGRIVGHRFALSMSIPVDQMQDEQAQDAFRKVGLSDVEVEASYVQGVDLKNKSFFVDPLSVEIKGFGRIAGGLHLSNAPVESYLSTGSIDTGMLMGLSLDRFELSYKDEGALPKLLVMAAEEQQMSVKDLIGIAVDQMHQAAGTGPDAEKLAPVIAAVEQFLQAPGELKLVASPAQPLPLPGIVAAAMLSPASLADALHLTVESR